MNCPSCGAKQALAETCFQCGEPLQPKKHGALFWLAVIGAAIPLLCGFGYGALMFMIVNSEESDVAETFVRESADVQKALGGEPSIAWLRDGSITSSDSVNGKARFVLTATGPKGEAHVVVELMRSGSAWGITNAGIVGANGSVSALSRERVKK